MTASARSWIATESRRRQQPSASPCVIWLVSRADTSAWVEYDRATDSLVDRRMRELIGHGSTRAFVEQQTGSQPRGSSPAAPSAVLTSTA
jgi:hypothetical protein